MPQVATITDDDWRLIDIALDSEWDETVQTFMPRDVARPMGSLKVKEWVHENLKATCWALGRYEMRVNNRAKSRLTHSRLNRIHRIKLKLECFGGRPTIPISPTPDRGSHSKSEKERMRDFFFGKKRGSFLNLKSWED